MAKAEGIGALLQRLGGYRSLRDLEDLTGVSHTYLGKITQRDHRPSYDVLKKIARGLDLGPDQVAELFRGAGYDPPSADPPYGQRVERLAQEILAGREPADMAEVLAGVEAGIEQHSQLPEGDPEKQRVLLAFNRAAVYLVFTKQSGLEEQAPLLLPDTTRPSVSASPAETSD